MLIAAVLVVASIAGALPARAADAFLEGRVVDAAGTPINGIRLDIYAQPDGGEISTTPTSVVTNSLGQYSAGVASGGSYRVKFTDTITTREAGPFPSEWHLDAASMETATPIAVPSPGVTSLPDTVLVAPVIEDFIASPDPVIVGTPALGSTLTVDPGIWDPAPEFTYTWLRNGNPTGYTGSSYRIQGIDGGSAITVAVTGKKAGFRSVTRTSLPVSVPLFDMAPSVPVISGEALTGHIIQAIPGYWQPSASSYSYEWFRNGVAVSGRTGYRYTLTEDDLGKTLTVKVTGKATGYHPASKTSSPTQVVAPGTFTPVTPTITGEARGGSVLTAQSGGTWGVPVGFFSYQWYRAGTPIPGAASQHYVPAGPDLGQSLSVQVTAKASGVATASKMSEPTGSVVPGTLNEVPPEISGAASLKVGQYLSVKFPGATYGASYKYQWYRNGAAVSGATKSTYYPGVDDLGTNTYTVHVTVSKSGYASYAKTSGPLTATVAKGDFSGVKELTLYTYPIVSSTWRLFDDQSWQPAASYNIQWYRDGTPIKSIEGGMYYRPGLADLGTHTYKVVLTGSKPGYNTVTKSKTVTLTVQKANLEIFPDAKLTGTAKVGYTLTATRPNQGWNSSFLPDQNMVPTVRYQWYRSGVAIKGATGKTYRLTGADAGKTIKARFTISLIGYNTVSPYTKSSAVVAKGTLKTSTPTISGTKKVGYRLTANPRTWTAGTKFKYQWYRSGKPIKGAVYRTYKLTSADRHDTMKVRVTGYQTGWNTASKTSYSTAKVR